MAAFLYAETKAKEPIISFRMFKDRLFASSSLVSLFYGAAFIGGTVYISIFMQGVLGGTATNSGLVLLPMMLGVVAASQIGAMMASKVSYRTVMIFSALVLIAALVLLSTLTPKTTSMTVTIFMIIAGLGTGASFSVVGMSAIHRMDATQRGSANSTVALLRSLGMTVGITVFGILQRNVFTGKMTDAFSGTGQALQGVSISDPRELLSQQRLAVFSPEQLTKITGALSDSIVQMFLWALVPAVLALLSVFLMTRDKLTGGFGMAAPSKPAVTEPERVS
jgi:predicted MFS family arabinose efflux permease